MIIVTITDWVTTMKNNLSKNLKIRMTRQRKAILDALKSVRTHPTADQVYNMVRRHIPNMSLGTVYRNLEILCQHGLAQKLELGGTQRQYDGNVDEHYHVRCIHCGKVDDIWFDEETSIEIAKPQNTEFEIIGHRLDFFGVCPECKEKFDSEMLNTGLH